LRAGGFIFRTFFVRGRTAILFSCGVILIGTFLFLSLSIAAVRLVFSPSFAIQKSKQKSASSEI